MRNTGRLVVTVAIALGAALVACSADDKHESYPAPTDPKRPLVQDGRDPTATQPGQVPGYVDAGTTEAINFGPGGLQLASASAAEPIASVPPPMASYAPSIASPSGSSSPTTGAGKTPAGTPGTKGAATSAPRGVAPGHGASPGTAPGAPASGAGAGAASGGKLPPSE